MARLIRPQLSVVVPYFDVEHYIADCLDSIARQTFGDMEVVLVDDGSRDGSAEVARAFCSSDPRFRVVVQENQGLGPARNTGVKEAQGEYVTFVDSDDLISRYAFGMLVRSLDESGSSFAGGDARRFSSRGVSESFVHRLPFAKDRVATHVTERPELALDRMVWNKVYRRSFWDEHGYAFPAIRYEDWPVTLKAHLDAVAVDVLSAPVYYWREREFGESITQQKYRYDNLHDRVTSAEAVLALAASAPAAVRTEVHAHLASIDLTALVQAFGTVPSEQEELLVTLGQRLAGQLDASASADAGAFTQMQFHALRAGDAAFLRRLALFRDQGGLRRGVPARRSARPPFRLETLYPGAELRRPPVPRAVYRTQPSDLGLLTSVTNIEWEGSVLRVSGTAEIQHLRSGPDTHLMVRAAAGRVEVPCEVVRHVARDQADRHSHIGFIAAIDVGALYEHPDAGKVVEFRVTVTNGRTRRTAELRGLQSGRAEWAPGAWVADDVWVQPRTASDGRLLLVRVVRPWHVTELFASKDAVVVHGVAPGARSQAVLRVRRTGSHQPMQVPVVLNGSHFSAWFPVSAGVDAENPDDPFSLRTTRSVHLVAGREELLLLTGPTASVHVAHEGRVLTATRSPGNVLTLQDGPKRVTADDVHLTAVELRVSGPVLAGPATHLSWRRWTHDGAHLHVPCAVEVVGDRWVAVAPVEQLVGGAAGEPDPLTGFADWAMEVGDGEGTAQAVVADPFLSLRLPTEVAAGPRTLAVFPPRGVLRARCR